MSFTGYALPALTIGLGAFRIRPQRGFFPGPNAAGVTPSPFVPHATIEELHRDDLEITEHPVELGAPIADHAFVRPSEVIIRCSWSNSPPGSPGLLGAAVGVAGVFAPVVAAGVAIAQTIPAAQSMLSGNAPQQARDTYDKLLALQASRVPFDVYTGKRVYRNMLFRSLGCTTDRETENVLSITAVCKQVIIVRTTTVQVPVNTAAQGQPEKTSPVVNAGQKQLKSAPLGLGSGFYGVL